MRVPGGFPPKRVEGEVKSKEATKAEEEVSGVVGPAFGNLVKVKGKGKDLKTTEATEKGPKAEPTHNLDELYSLRNELLKNKDVPEVKMELEKVDKEIDQAVESMFNTLKEEHELWKSKRGVEKTDDPDVTYPDLYMPVASYDRFAGDIRSPKLTNVGFGLHANYVNGKSGQFIALQVPGDTTNVACEPVPFKFIFWTGACELSDLIVDVSHPDDITPYYPSEEGKKVNEWGTGEREEISLTLLDQKRDEENENIVTSTYEVERKGKEPKKITRIHYQGWEDHTGTNTESLKRLVGIMNKNSKKGTPPYRAL